MKFVFCISLLIGISPLFAAEFDQLIGDTDLFGNDVEQALLHENAEKAEFDLQNEGSLFPGNADEVDHVSDSQDPITISVDGITIELRDVPRNAWFSRYVQSAAERGIVSGYKDSNGKPKGIYGPSDSVTIEQLAKIALEASDNDITSCDGTLKNAAAVGMWSEQYIACTEGLGWAVFSDGSVNILRPATRSEVVVTILQAFSITIIRGSGNVFKDVTASTEFSGAIEKAALDSMVSGFADEFGVLTGRFGPRDPVNRAEIAKMIILAVEIYGK